MSQSHSDKKQMNNQDSDLQVKQEAVVHKSKNRYHKTNSIRQEEKNPFEKSIKSNEPDTNKSSNSGLKFNLNPDEKEEIFKPRPLIMNSQIRIKGTSFINSLPKRSIEQEAQHPLNFNEISIFFEKLMELQEKIEEKIFELRKHDQKEKAHRKNLKEENRKQLYAAQLKSESKMRIEKQFKREGLLKEKEELRNLRQSELDNQMLQREKDSLLELEQWMKEQNQYRRQLRDSIEQYSKQPPHSQQSQKQTEQKEPSKHLVNKRNKSHSIFKDSFVEQKQPPKIK